MTEKKPRRARRPKAAAPPRYDVAISYASEDIESADVLASRFRQDGYRLFYAPSRLHRLLGLELLPELRRVFSEPATFVVALVSPAYLRKVATMTELEAAAPKAGDRLIIALCGGANLPEPYIQSSYADVEKFGIEAIAVQISNTLGERIDRQPNVTFRPVGDFEFEPTILPIDRPEQAYRVEDVDFIDTEQSHIVDIHTPSLEWDDPRLYVTRHAGVAWPPGLPFPTRDDIVAAKAETAALVTTKAREGWPIFNGRKFGVAMVQRTRTPENERHRIIIQTYETDYLTSLFAKRLYWRLSADGFRLHPSGSLAGISGLIASIGMDALLFFRGEDGPRILIARRSHNVANAAGTGGRLHVSMNEGVSASDRYATEFDARATIYRGLKEELHIDRHEISHVEIYEPFVELTNLELGFFVAAYTPLTWSDLEKRAAFASDSHLELADLTSIPATRAGVQSLLGGGQATTNLLRFCLQSAAYRQLISD